MKSQDPKITRRKFVRGSALVAGGVLLAPGILTSCLDEPDFVGNPGKGESGFYEGVASFDPSHDKIILWTRYRKADFERRPTVKWVMATDPEFKNIVKKGSVRVSASRDYTISVDVQGLDSNTEYYYSFFSVVTKAASAIGRTKTLPYGAEAGSVALAFVSCANFQSGFFNVYGAVAESEADVVVHLGDYIYEYGIGEYGTNELTATLSREHQPGTEILSLDDYRTRYKQYRRDRQLQKAHQMKPFICVWDDHEVTNDAWTDGAENHTPDEGSFQERKQRAIQAWNEYLPARVSDPSVIYRKFEFGSLASLFMLDTRIIGRNEQLDYANYFNLDGSFNTTDFIQDWQSPNRTLLGPQQLAWLSGELASSTAEWNVLGSQVLAAKVNIPAELLALTAQLASNPSPEVLALYNQILGQLVGLKARFLAGDPTLTPQEVARIQTVLPYNLDAWDGYPVEREKVFGAASGKKLVSLAGDTHNGWQSDLRDFTGKKVGVEFATASVSSPGFEQLTGPDPAAIAGFEQANTILVDDVNYLDASRRGYCLVEFTSGAASCEWRYISTLAVEDTSVTVGHTATA